MPSRAMIRLEHQERCIGCYNCVFACSLELFGIISATRTAISIKPCSLGDPFVITFCTGCESPPCVMACPAQVLRHGSDGKIKLVDSSQCGKCKTFDCAKACTIGALPIDQVTNCPILCTQCGKCSESCPHEVIAYNGRRV